MFTPASVFVCCVYVSVCCVSVCCVSVSVCCLSVVKKVAYVCF